VITAAATTTYTIISDEVVGVGDGVVVVDVGATTLSVDALVWLPTATVTLYVPGVDGAGNDTVVVVVFVPAGTVTLNVLTNEPFM
jgi:hypothetical protein